MRYIIVVLVCLAAFFACNTHIADSGTLLTPDNLETTQYVINTDRDTTIETKNGALLKIPKGSLAGDNGNTVTLDIKEAYSLQQMIMAGLTTQSNGDPLSSGGMIYINAAAGQHVIFKQKIQVAIPADFLQKGMQLYKGDTQANGKINWTNPAALPVNKQLTMVDSGQVLFQKNCASCHAIGRDLTGPNLAHFMKRFPPKEENEKYYQAHLVNYLQAEPCCELNESENQQKSDTINKRDAYYLDHYHPDLYRCNLKKLFPAAATSFTDMEIADFIKIYRYIQNESDRLNLPLPGHAYLKDCVDSCELYKKKVENLIAQKLIVQSKRKRLVKANGPLVDKKPDSTWRLDPTAPLPPDFDKKVSPQYYDAEYYQFTIESFGWYNIDMMEKNIEGVQQSQLFVKITGDYRGKIKTYLIIPSVKVYGEGGPAERNAEEFAFFYKDGSLPLPQGVPAYILAVTETEQSIAFGLKEFTTSTSQELTMELHASSKEEFTAAMKQFDMNRLHINVADAKNASEIRKSDTTLLEIDKQLKESENLRPRNCDCNCGGHPTISTAVAPIESK